VPVIMILPRASTHLNPALSCGVTTSSPLSRIYGFQQSGCRSDAVGYLRQSGVLAEVEHGTDQLNQAIVLEWRALSSCMPH